MPRHTSSLQNNLKQARTIAGLTQGELAGQVGISRQAYSSLESGQSTPSTEVAIRLAHRLGGRVESLFYLPEQPPVAIDAELVSGASFDTSLNSPDQRARIFRVGQKLLARPLSGPENTRHAVVAAEGLIVPTPGAHGGGGVVTVQPFDLDEVDSPTLAMLGCDPAVGLLETGLRAKGVALVTGEESSRQALMGLANGEAHVAGCHLLDDATGTYNSAWVRLLVPFPCTLVTFASWQQGLIIAYGNPKQINGEADLGIPGVRLVNRQAGSGSRDLLDRALSNAGISTENIEGYDREEWGHLAVAAAVASGTADVGIGVKAAAVAMGMEFIPIEEERYDLVIPDHFLSETSVQVLLDLLRRPTLHRRVESLGGYDASQMGIQASAN
ncbi:MAG TPA: helix-turn-helix domain-containing protein [Dehalococcoidia bacterium]|nr:helix-turn-helix domain-containing protein [Dehalococcoidia bacterium]